MHLSKELQLMPIVLGGKILEQTHGSEQLTTKLALHTEKKQVLERCLLGYFKNTLKSST